MSAKTSRVIIFILLFAFCFIGTRAQDARVKSADNEFIMEIYRESTSVRVVLYFVDASKYSYLIVEKQVDEGQFRRCAYVDLTQSDFGGAIEAKDNYPLSPFDDSYYRVRTVTTDRIERIYPPLLLPGTTEECHDGQ